VLPKDVRSPEDSAQQRSYAKKFTCFPLDPSGAA